MKMKKISGSGKGENHDGSLVKKDASSAVFDPKPFPIVAFGASAGGIKAFTTLLKQLDIHLGMAYVLVMHLSPNHKSALAEIIQAKTKMPVHTVSDGMELKADNIFVIPPNTFMSVVDGHLKLAPRSSLDIGNFAIDFFMTGLAEVYKNNAIGVILSGTATDGTLGLKAIKAGGGITMAQDGTAEFEGMPQSAVESGYVDFKLPPEGIAKELERLTKTFYTNLPSDKMEVVSAREINTQSDEFRKILALVKDKTGVDFFHHYKQASIYRRLMRRMVLNQFEMLSDYRALLKTDPAEVSALFDDFLINVTNFFRDPDFYQALSNEIFPALIRERKSGDPLRIWVAGCATGEEAYSVAIMLNEYLTGKKLTVPFQIFASDLDERAIEKARLGIYPVSAMSGVSEKFLNQYFKKIDSQYQVVKAIRENCVYAHHNLLKDPPFSRMDLISCQNVLIYLETGPQRKILQTFHYALKPNRYLFLAKSETVGSTTDFFEPLDKRIRYYSRKSTSMPSMDFTMHMAEKTGETRSPRIDQALTLDVDIERDMSKLMLSRFVYPGVVVNKHMTITQFFGETSVWLKPPSGRASFNILKMIREDLVVELRTLLQEARHTQLPAVKEGIRVLNKKIAQELTLEVVPKKISGGLFFLVVFKENQPTPAQESSRVKTAAGNKAQAIARLEADLVHSLEVIRTTTEEYETTYEELQANNEEILSANEELQSVNEELETSKEELQSSNEELTTINEELNKRNIELKDSYDYTEAIVETMHGPLLVLTSNLQVRRANKSFYQNFQLTPEKTVGNYLYDMGDGAWNIPALREQLKDGRPGLPTFSSFDLTYFFKGLGERDLTINVYRLSKGDSPKEALILLAFDDFTRRYSAEKSLLKTQEQLKLSLIGDSIGTWWWDLTTDQMKWSAENEHLNGLEDGVFRGNFKDWEAVIHPEDITAVKKVIKKAMDESAGKSKDQLPVEVEYRVVWPDHSVHWLLSRGHIYFDSDHKPNRMVGVTMDNTERKLNAEHLEHLVKSRTAELTSANNALTLANQQLEQYVFISSHDLQEPLRKIRTFYNLLNGEKSNLNAYSLKYLVKINEAASRMSDLLSDLHSFSTIKDDPSKFMNVSLNEVIREVLGTFAVRIEMKQAVVNFSPLPEVHGHPFQIRQLFSHLLSNSLKFSKEKPVIDITAKAVKESDYALHPELARTVSYVSVSITDNGIGFQQKYADKLFVLFQQLKDVHATGTGIGLAICKKIVTHHRGYICAEGSPGKGATFTVFLPQAQ